MLDWHNIQGTITKVLSTVSGDHQTVWSDQRAPYVDPELQAIVILRLAGSEAVGVDDVRYVHHDVPAPAPPIEETLFGNRKLTIEVRVESFDTSYGRQAFNVAERMRTRMRLTSNRETLCVAGLSIITTGKINDVGGVVVDDHEVSVATFDVSFLATFLLSDGEESSNMLHAIESVNNPVDNVGTVIQEPK